MSYDVRLYVMENRGETIRTFQDRECALKFAEELAILEVCDYDEEKVCVFNGDVLEAKFILSRVNDTIIRV